jgi:hypothetical protein
MEINDDSRYLMEYPNALQCAHIEKIILSFECRGNKVTLSDLFIGGCKCEETGGCEMDTIKLELVFLTLDVRKILDD